MVVVADFGDVFVTVAEHVAEDVDFCGYAFDVFEGDALAFQD